MRNEIKRPQKGLLRSFSSYLRIVSNGASSVASTVKSVGSSVANSVVDTDYDSASGQVYWSGFDKHECENGTLRQVLLLGYSNGFQVWDVENANDVRLLVSTHDGPVSFLQMLKKPTTSENNPDNFFNVRPLLIIAGDASLSSNTTNFDANVGSQDTENENSSPTFVHLYSLKTHDYIHVLKFRTSVYTIRCSHRVVAISQATQIQCFDAGTFEKLYTILTWPITSRDIGSGGIGYGPLAVGPRWLAYSGRPVIVSNPCRVTPQHLSSDKSSSQLASNGSLVAHYAKESSKHIAAGILTLGDIGYKKLSRYYSEYVTDGNGSMKNQSSNFGSNGRRPDMDIAGMVIVRDIVLRSVVVQFRAHRSPITALCFDPSGTLLVTASINGHNINVFRIMPSDTNSSDFNVTGSAVHLFRLHRGITNAVIQDISFSDDSQWIIISSSRGTSHLYSVSDAIFGSIATTIMEPQSKMSAVVALSPTSRIRNGYSWKNTVTDAAAAATGRSGPLPTAIASVFHNCKASGPYPNFNPLRKKYHFLVFSPIGSVIQYALTHSPGVKSRPSPVSNGELHYPDSKLAVEALQKWDICPKKNIRDQENFSNVYSDLENGDSSKLFLKGPRKGTNVYPTDTGFDAEVKNSSNTDENHHMYISEVELHTHSAKVHLWAKPEMYFQVLMAKNIWEGDYCMTGEIEIEKFSAQTIEARSKTIDYIQLPWFQQSSKNSVESERYKMSNVLLTYNKLEGSKNGSSGSICHASERSVSNSNENLTELCSSIEGKGSFVSDTGLEGLEVEACLENVSGVEALSSVNGFPDVDACAESENEFVNSRNGSESVENEFKPVNSENSEGFENGGPS